MEICNTCGKIYRERNEEHISYDIIVPYYANELLIYFEYSPEILEDTILAKGLLEEAFLKEYEQIPDNVQEYLPIHNFLSLSVDSPKGLVGTSHRHMAKIKIRINEKSSSRGYFPAQIIAGVWKIVITVHSISSDYVDFQLRVEVNK